MPSKWVFRFPMVTVIVLQLLGNYMIIKYLDPYGKPAWHLNIGVLWGYSDFPGALWVDLTSFALAKLHNLENL